MSNETNQYGYGIDPLTQQLMFLLATKDQGAQSGRYQDLVSMMFDPKFAAMGGNFDPMLTAPQQFVPDLSAYVNLFGGLNSTEPAIKQVAQWVLDGQIDSASAAGYIKDTLGVSEYDNPNGLTPQAVDSLVGKIFDDVAKLKGDQQKFESDQRAAVAENVFSKAGLPQPWEQYTSETVPRTSAQQAMLNNMLKTAQRVEGVSRAASRAGVSAERAKRSEIAQAAKASPTVGTTLEVGVPRTEAEARNYASTLGVDENWFVDKWRGAFQAATPYDVVKSKNYSEQNKVYDVSYRAAETDWDKVKSLLSDDINREISNKENFAEWTGMSNLDKERALKVREALDNPNFVVGPKKMNQTQEQKNEEKLLINRAAVKAGQDRAREVASKADREKKGLEFQSGLASAMLAGQVRGTNRVTSPLKDALLSRLTSTFGM